MPKSLTQYRIFIGSPSGLEEERKQFRLALEKCNMLHAEPRGVIFYPVGWEDKSSGGGRPQEQINEDLRKCDYAVFVLHDHWGSSTSGGGYSSGTEEEWELAEKLYKDAKLFNIALFFKQPSSSQLRDPGEDLKKVVEFKQQIEKEQKYLFKSFAQPDEFHELLEKQLAEWLRDREGTPPSLANVLVERINFDYLPDSPLNHDWTVGYNDPGAGAKWLGAADASISDSISIEMDDPHCAIDYRVSRNAALSDRLTCDVKFSDSTMLFVRVQLASGDGSGTTKLIKYILGTESPSPTQGYEDHEWTLPISPPALRNGWRRLDIILADSVAQTWGRFGWRFRGLLMIRLRGKLSISPISL